MRSASKLIRPLLVLAPARWPRARRLGCGTTTADPARGRASSSKSAASATPWRRPGTTATSVPTSTPPSPRRAKSGEDSDTIEGIVKAQVEFPRPDNGNPAVSMPADIVTGQDLDDVAAYVGGWAGVPGAAPPEVPGGPGAQVFANNGCGGCHALAAAGSGGVTGPDLDEVLPADAPRKSKRRSSTRTRKSPRATRPT